MDMIVKSESLTSVADAIREKGETTEQLVFPDGFVTAIQGIKAGTSIPAFTYTGEHIVEVEPGTENWKIKFLTSGDLILTQSLIIDVFLVGGGGGGGSSYSAGGGSGYTITQQSVSLDAGTYSIVIGAGGDIATSGGYTSAFGFEASGGEAGTSSKGGNGGSGGAPYDAQANGGSDGSDGFMGYYNQGTPGKGQGTTTREFGESDGKLYAGGGAGGYYADNNYQSQPGKGGAGGGADPLRSAADNTGGGGGGGVHKGSSGNISGGEGGSGIVVIRNTRAVTE